MIYDVCIWAALSVINLAMTLVGIGLAPVLPLFAVRGYLPWWLSYFGTPDNSLDGDEGYQKEHAPFKGIQTGFKRYVNRILWLLRNPIYGFGYSVLGARIEHPPLVISGDPLVSDSKNLRLNRQHGLSGHVTLRCGRYWEFYLIHQYGNNRCLRIRMGWKLSGYVNEPTTFKLGTKAQHVLSVKIAGKFD